jgi:galactokinase
VGENCRFTQDNILEKKEVSWDSYVQAVLREMMERGHAVQGIQCVFGGDIPIGAGLSSSAALCCGLAYGVSVLQNLNIDKREIALIGQAAEHRIGLNCGLMDQYAVLFGQADHLLCLDCRSLEFQLLPLRLEGYSLVLLNSKVKHQLAAGSGYNQRRRSCENVVATLRLYNPALKSLRDVPPNLLKANETLLDPLDCKRAKYVLGENERVMQMTGALQNNDLQSIGDLLYQSHEGLRREYEVTVPEIDLLIDLAQKEENILGARMVGGGFGGCTLNLIKTVEKEVVLQRISEAYFTETGIRPEAIEVMTGRGVGEV